LYVAHQAWLDTAPEPRDQKKPSKQKPVIRRKSRQISEQQKEPPEIYATRFYIDALWQVGPAEFGEYGSKPVNWTEINNWNQAAELGLKGWELETIRDLSCVYSSWSNQAKSPDCRSPLEPVTKQSAEDIENKLLKQFGIMK
jgi:hypothetical protein